MQKEASSSTTEAADILPQLPEALRQDVLWVSMEVTVQSIGFLKVRPGMWLTPASCCQWQWQWQCNVVDSEESTLVSAV